MPKEVISTLVNLLPCVRTVAHPAFLTAELCLNAVDPTVVAFGMMVHVMTALQSVMPAGGHWFVNRKVASGTLIVYLVNNLMPHVLVRLKNIEKENQMRNVKVNLIHALEELNGEENV